MLENMELVGVLPRTSVVDAAAGQAAEVVAGIEVALDVLAASPADDALARRLRFVLHATLEAAENVRETLAVSAPAS